MLVRYEIRDFVDKYSYRVKQAEVNVIGIVYETENLVCFAKNCYDVITLFKDEKGGYYR